MSEPNNVDVIITARVPVAVDVAEAWGPPGPQGPPGQPGPVGTPSWTVTTAAATEPPVGGTVTLSVQNTGWISVGAPVRVGTSTYVVVAVTTTTVTLVRLGTNQNGGGPEPVRQWDVGGRWDSNLGWDR